jgi:TPR repeat protein
MLKYYLIAIEEGSVASMNNVGLYYENIKDYDNMLKYYLMAIAKDCCIAMFNLGLYYKRHTDYVNMLKYYLMAINKGCPEAMCSLAGYYCDQEDYVNMSKYYLMAIEKRYMFAMYNYGSYHANIGDYDNMATYFIMAVENGHDTCIIDVFAFFHHGDINKGINVFNDLHKKGIQDADKYLGKLLSKSNTSLLEYVVNKQIIEKQLDAMKEEMNQMNQYITELEFAPKLFYKN